MKNVLKTMIAIALLTVSTISLAAEKPETLNLSMADQAIEAYINVVAEGGNVGLEQLFASDFNTNICGKDFKINSREALLKFYKKQKGEKQNCETTATILEKGDDYVVAKIRMKFENFEKIDLVTISKEAGIWQVSKSIQSYK